MTIKIDTTDPALRKALRESALAGDANALDALLGIERVEELKLAQQRFDEALRRAFNLPAKTVGS